MSAASTWPAVLLALALAALLHLASGCAVPVGNASPEQAIAAELAIAEWELSYGFAPACELQAPSLRWETAPDLEALRARCGAPDRIACNLTTLDGETTIVVLADDRYPAESYAHELVHWLQDCATGVDDDEHAAPGVWGSRALEGRLAARLSAELGLEADL